MRALTELDRLRGSQDSTAQRAAVTASDSGAHRSVAGTLYGMSTSRIVAFVLVLALLAGGGVFLLNSLGDPVTAALHRYDEKLLPILDREQQLWTELTNRLDARETRLDAPVYFDFLEEQAIPRYRELLTAVRALEVEHEELVPLSQRAERYLELRVEFVQGEADGRDLMRRAQRSSELFALEDDERAAIYGADEYQRAVDATEERVIDGRFTRLRRLGLDFRSDVLDPFLEQQIGVEAVQRRLREHVVPELEAMSQSERGFGEDERGRTLSSAVRQAIRYYKRLDDAELLVLFRDLRRQAASAEARAVQADRELLRIRDEKQRLKR